MNNPTNEPKNVTEKGIEIFREKGIVEFSRKLFRYAKRKANFFALPYTLLSIKLLKRNCNLQEAIVLSFDGFDGLITPMQIRYEISELLKKLEWEAPKIILEIGSANGGTLFLFSLAAREDATIISVDLPRGSFGGSYPAWKIPLYKAFAQKKQKIHLIRANSHSNATLEKIEALLENRSIDFLFIDGDHSGVEKDFEMYSSLVKKGGIIAFHDIVPGSKEYTGVVPKFWREIKGKYESEEIVKDWAQGGFGIGIIYM